MADRELELLDSLPRMGPLVAKALLAAPKSGGPRIPSRTAAVAGHTQDRGRLADYDRVCGFALRDRVPATWLHVLTFALHVHLLSSSDSSIRLAGIVHVSNRMTQHRPVMADEVLDLQVRATNLRPHRRGGLLDLAGEVRVGDELVWDGVSTYLATGVNLAGQPEESGTSDWSPIPPSALWRLPADLGVAYRQVSHDPNPIHTSRLAARAFGFSRPIVHGMWTHARALAALEPRLPERYTVSVWFLRPIMLPATVSHGAERAQDGWRQAVMTRDGDKPFMTVGIE